MKLGLHIADFTWPEGAPRLGPVLADVATAADEAGFDRTRYAGLGCTVGHGMVAGVSDLRKIETMRTEVMPAIEAL